MQRLIGISDTLVTNYDTHTDFLQQAQNITNEILNALEETAISAAALGDVFSGQRSISSWWLYIWCPMASLVVGSYGLPPSLLRNVILVIIGKVYFPFDGPRINLQQVRLQVLSFLHYPPFSLISSVTLLQLYWNHLFGLYKRQLSTTISQILLLSLSHSQSCSSKDAHLGGEYRAQWYYHTGTYGTSLLLRLDNK